MKGITSTLLSVRLMVYDNEAYIRATMDGIMMQKTSFNVEVVVGDDFSSDNTLKIIKEYRDKEKIKIRILERFIGGEYFKKRKELGRKYNFFNIIENCNGKYIALLDGDDYWTDEDKLEKQVQFLEENPDFSICFHNVNLLMPNGEFKEFLKNFSRKEHIEIRKELIKKNIIASCSVVYRNDKSIPYSDFYDYAFVDYPLYFLLFQRGKVKYFDSKMGIYRIHNEGIWSGMPNTEKLKELIRFYELFLTPKINIKGEQKVLKKKKHELYRELLKSTFKERKISMIFFYIKILYNKLM